MRVMDLGNCTIVCSLFVNANYFFEVKSDDVRDSTGSEMSDKNRILKIIFVFGRWRRLIYVKFDVFMLVIGRLGC